MKKNILITGATGYIGSHGVVAFEQAWYKVVMLDNFSNSSMKSLDGIEKILWYSPDFFEVDLRDKTALEKVFQEYNFDWVIHFAWLKSVAESCTQALKYFDNNVVGSMILFELMDKHSVKNIVFSSSATVYDAENTLPLTEQASVWNTSNPYGTTKFLLEKILEDLSKKSWFNVINLRYFNPIGAHSSWYIWENPKWIPNNLLPFIIKTIAGELPELKVFGNDYNTLDGSWVRDYIDVVDLIDGHLKAYSRHAADSNSFEIYNLWVWNWVSVLEMISIAESVVGKKLNYSIWPRRDWDLGEVYCDPSKAKNILGWQAKTWVKQSIENSWKFYNKISEWNK